MHVVMQVVEVEHITADGLLGTWNKVLGPVSAWQMLLA